jgi:hypothetical protein
MLRFVLATAKLFPDFPKMVQKAERPKSKLSTCFELVPLAVGKDRRACLQAYSADSDDKLKLRRSS